MVTPPKKTKSGPDDSDEFDAESAIKKVGDTIERPDLFAEKFCAAARSQKGIENVLKELIRELLESDTAAKKSLKKLIKEEMDDDWKTWLRSRGFIIGAGLWSLATAAFGALLAYWLK